MPFSVKRPTEDLLQKAGTAADCTWSLIRIQREPSHGLKLAGQQSKLLACAPEWRHDRPHLSQGLFCAAFSRLCGITPRRDLGKVSRCSFIHWQIFTLFYFPSHASLSTPSQGHQHGALDVALCTFVSSKLYEKLSETNMHTPLNNTVAHT